MTIRSYTPIIYEGKDCSSQSSTSTATCSASRSGCRSFSGTQICVKLAAEMFGWDAFRPGDVFYMNDSYMTGTHLNDATIFGPIYWQDQLVGFSATRAHWLDVGGKDPGGPMDSREIYQEGMRWAPTGSTTRRAARGHHRPAQRNGLRLLARRRMNAGRRVPDRRARFQAILDRFGYGLEARQEIYRQSEELERETVSAIPDGTYNAEGFLDDDGLGHGPIPVKLRIDVEATG